MGDTVRWTWGAGTHNLRSISGIENFDSGYSSAAGNVFSYTSNQPGATSYQCDPRASNVNGTINVTTTSEPTTPPINEDFFQLSLGEPVNGQIHSGIGNLRGWVISNNGIDRVEIFIDGKYAYNAPYGDLRIDVEAAFPNVDGSALSGRDFCITYGEGDSERWWREEWIDVEDDEPIDIDAKMDLCPVIDWWALRHSANAKAYHYLKCLDLGPQLKNARAVGNLDFTFGACPENDYIGVEARDDVTLRLLQHRLNELEAGIKVELD